MKKFGGSNLIRIGFAAALVGNVLKFIFQVNIPLILAGSLLSGLGINILTMMGGIFVVDCMDYGEWKTGKRIEGLMNSIINFTTKVGMGLASAGIGIAMSLAGYVSGAPEQTPAALSSIVALFSIIPAGICIIMLVVMHFYRLDKELPKIKEELEARRAAAQGSIVL
jgi:Na+/melibiose symporter-like transporter